MGSFHEDFVRGRMDGTRLARTRWLSFSITRVEGVGNVEEIASGAIVSVSLQDT